MVRRFLILGPRGVDPRYSPWQPDHQSSSRWKLVLYWSAIAPLTELREFRVKEVEDPHLGVPILIHRCHGCHWRIWVFPKIGVPQNGWFIRETPIKMDDLGVTLFLETPIWINIGGCTKFHVSQWVHNLHQLHTNSTTGTRWTAYWNLMDNLLVPVKAGGKLVGCYVRYIHM